MAGPNVADRAAAARASTSPGMLALAGRDRPRGLRLLPADPDLGLGAGDEHVRDGHLGGPGGRGPVVRLRADLPQTFTALAGSGVALLGTVTAVNVPLLDPSIKQPSAGPAEQLLADDPRADRGLQLRRVRPGLGARADRDGLLPDGHLPPLAGFAELALPLVPGLPLLAVGAAGVAASYGAFGDAVGDRRRSLLRLRGHGRRRRDDLAGVGAGDRRRGRQPADFTARSCSDDAASGRRRNGRARAGGSAAQAVDGRRVEQGGGGGHADQADGGRDPRQRRHRLDQARRPRPGHAGDGRSRSSRCRTSSTGRCRSACS